MGEPVYSPPDPKHARLFVYLGWFTGWYPTMSATSTAVAGHRPETGSRR